MSTFIHQNDFDDDRIQPETRGHRHHHGYGIVSVVAITVPTLLSRQHQHTAPSVHKGACSSRPLTIMKLLIPRTVAALALCASTFAWVAPSQSQSRSPVVGGTSLKSTLRASLAMNGSLHGQDACFLPLKQLDQDYFSPRIVQIAGGYPGLTREEFFAVSSEPSPDQGQWSYDFSDPEGPQVGTVALEGSILVGTCGDPVVIIAEHPSLGVQLPRAITGAVDLVVLVDRAKATFAERKFLVIDTPGSPLAIGAFSTKNEIPAGSEILGQVVMVQVPWLPSMEATKSGFLEADEYY